MRWGDASPLAILSLHMIVCSSVHTRMCGSAGVCSMSSLVQGLKGSSLHLSSGKMEYVHCACTGLMWLGLLVAVPTMSSQDILLGHLDDPLGKTQGILAPLVPDLLPHRQKAPGAESGPSRGATQPHWPARRPPNGSLATLLLHPSPIRETCLLAISCRT